MANTLEHGIANIIKRELDIKYLKRPVTLKILNFLDSQGIVRKIEGGYPAMQSRLTERANMELLTKQGWSKTERLIND